jgi:hypothetical protein
MKGMMRSVLLVAGLAATGAPGLAGQDAPAEPVGARSLPGVEAIIRMRERLELSEAQVADLDAIRRESVERRSTAAAELAELRSQLAAGLIERSDVMAFVEQRRDEDRQYATERQERVQALLDGAQLESVQQLRQRGRAFARGRTGLRRGGRPGLRGRRPGVRGGRPDVREPRWGPPLVRGGRFWRRGTPALGLGSRLSWRS